MANPLVITQHLALAVAAGASGTLAVNVLARATLDAVTLQLYQGNQLALQLVPVLIRRGTHYPLINFAPLGKKFIDGDSLFQRMKVDWDVVPGVDQIAVDYTNTDGVNPYDFAVDFELLGGVGA